jgi:serine/threonine-protein kinase
LKPDNIFIIERDKQPDFVKILDFGIAKTAGEANLTRAGSVFGTPDYMSPEQVQGQRGDARSDVYALGVMLYEMLAGGPPFRGDNALAVMAQHVQARPPSLRARNRRVSPALEAVVLKALRKDPNLRYQTMAAFKDDLLHLDRVDPAALAAEAPDEVPAPRLPTLFTPGIMATLAVAAVLVLVAGLLLGRYLVP